MNDVPDSVTFTLKKPIVHGDQTYTTLTFNEATAGDLAAADSFTGEMTKTLVTLAGMANVPLQVIKALKASDLRRLNEQVAPLMGEDAPGKKPADPSTTGQIS